MPVATLDPKKYKRYELESAPADPNVEGDEQGYVMLRPLPFGLLLERNDNQLQMKMQTIRRPQDRQRKGAANEAPSIDMKNLNRAASEYDFAYCIGEHNLTDQNGQLIDFTNPMFFQILDPKIASEIQRYIDELNTPEGEESAEDFIKRVTSSPGEKVEQT